MDSIPIHLHTNTANNGSPQCTSSHIPLLPIAANVTPRIADASDNILHYIRYWLGMRSAWMLLGRITSQLERVGSGVVVGLIEDGEQLVQPTLGCRIILETCSECVVAKRFGQTQAESIASPVASTIKTGFACQKACIAVVYAYASKQSHCA